MRDSGDGLERAVAIGQGSYYVATGVWPLVHEASFELVTGPKLERWLVKTVGVLVSAIGATLVAAGARRRIAPETRLLAVSAAAGIALVEGWYAGKGRVAPVYLADAAGETALVLAWGAAAALRRREGRARSSRGELGREAAAYLGHA